MGAPAAPAPDPEPTSEYKPDPAWNKLLLVAGAIVVVVALLVVPGILNRGGQNPVAEAAQATLRWPGERMSFTASGSGPGATVSMKGSGVMNGETNRALIEISATANTAEGAHTYRASQVDDGTDYYFRSPEISEAIGAGSPWLLIKGEALGELAQQSGGGGFMKVGGVESPSGPRQQLDLLQQASSDVRAVGQEQVGGATTTHYTGTIDFQKVIDKYDDELTDRGVELLEQAMQQRPAETVHVWIDDQGLIRRESATTSAEPSMRITTTVDFYDFGAQPQIAVPPASQVHDVTPLIQQALDGILK